MGRGKGAERQALYAFAIRTALDESTFLISSALYLSIYFFALFKKQQQQTN